MAQVKTVNKVLNVEQVEKMLNHFETYGFIKIITNKAIQFGFVTEFLKEYVRKEWILTNVLSSDQSAFLLNSLKTKDNLKNAFKDIQNLVSTVPFSLVEIDSSCNEKEESLLPETATAVDLVSHQFKRQTGSILKNQTFCSPANAVELFYKRQRERKIWWRKFSALPGRFINSNVSSKENDKSMISEIQAEFPWGFQTVETIKYLPDFCTKDKEDFEVKAGKRKKCIPQVISCETVLENMAFTYLCDSYERLNGENEREVLKFNRKLAPYKVAIAGSGKSSDIVKNLEEVSLLLAKQLRKLGLSVLLLPDVCTTSVERQILRNDALGVPYTIIVNDNTLKDGAIALRGRDTTLKEHSHVSLIVDHLDKILK